MPGIVFWPWRVERWVRGGETGQHVSMISAPPTAPQAGWPAGWQLFCHAGELGLTPVSRQVCGRPLVGFRTEAGKVAVLDARCVHMGSDLALGDVVGDTIRCPFHHWQFDASGHCVANPATEEIPPFARQAAYRTAEKHGLILVSRNASFPVPFFPDTGESELHAARAFSFRLNCPWHMVGGNAVDVQHFLAAHDRKLLEAPSVEFPDRWSHRTIGRFRIAGSSFRDRLTRLVAGDTVEMEITDWAGTLIFVRARFRRTTSYGLVAIQAIDDCHTRISVVVSVQTSRTWLGRTIFDPLNAAVRRHFIHRFLSADVDRSQGTDFNPLTSLEADSLMADYLNWLGSLPAQYDQDNPATTQHVSVTQEHAPPLSQEA